MLSNGDRVQKILLDMEGGYIREAGAGLTEDFQYIDLSGAPLSKDNYLNLMQALVSAVPDWSYHISDMKEYDDSVTFKTRITGTQSGRLEIPSLRIFSLPSTGRQILMPEEHVEAVFRDGKISRLEVSRSEGGGIAGILKQLGIDMPSPAYV